MIVYPKLALSLEAIRIVAETTYADILTIFPDVATETDDGLVDTVSIEGLDELSPSGWWDGTYLVRLPNGNALTLSAADFESLFDVVPDPDDFIPRIALGFDGSRDVDLSANDMLWADPEPVRVGTFECADLQPYMDALNEYAQAMVLQAVERRESDVVWNTTCDCGECDPRGHVELGDAIVEGFDRGLMVMQDKINEILTRPEMVEALAISERWRETAA